MEWLLGRQSGLIAKKSYCTRRLIGSILARRDTLVPVARLNANRQDEPFFLFRLVASDDRKKLSASRDVVNFALLRDGDRETDFVFFVRRLLDDHLGSLLLDFQIENALLVHGQVFFGLPDEFEALEIGIEVADFLGDVLELLVNFVARFTGENDDDRDFDLFALFLRACGHGCEERNETDGSQQEPKHGNLF